MSERPTSTRAAAPHSERWWGEVWAVFRKDLLSELRTRAAIATILLFAVCVLVIARFVMDTENPALLREALGAREFLEQLKIDPKADPFRNVAETTKVRSAILSGLIWIVLFFSAMAGLPRTFVKEEEMRTAPILRLTARPSAVFTGKLLFNAALSLAVVLVVLFLFLILFHPVIGNWPSFLLHLPLGALAMAGGATIVGAMVARAGGKNYLMLPLAFPILLPVLILAINGTTAAIHGKGENYLVALVSYLVVTVTLSALLFESVWNEA